MSTSTNAGDTAPKGRGALIGLAALFFLPLLGAFWLYYAGGWRPAGATNYGELISPARPLIATTLLNMDGIVASPELFKGKWTLVHLNDGTCDETCRKALWTARQTRLLLAEDMSSASSRRVCRAVHSALRQVSSQVPSLRWTSVHLPLKSSGDATIPSMLSSVVAMRGRAGLMSSP